MVYELFLDLGASDEQLNFSTIYTASKQGIAKMELTDDSDNLDPLLDLILEKVKPASSAEASDKLLSAPAF